MSALDARWLATHPLPQIAHETDKNERGRVLVVGGSHTVPGAVALTAEAALRAGAGKVQIATVAASTTALGVAMPEAAVFALPTNDDGEISEGAAGSVATRADDCDALVLGPGMGRGSEVGALIAAALGKRGDRSYVLDAAALRALSAYVDRVRAQEGRVVLTPHPGEMCALIGCSEREVAMDPQAIARRAASHFGCVVVLKQSETWIAVPAGALLHYAGGGPGLATAGSGDVLAGVVGGLLARGTPPLVAAAWGVWLHGEAGRRCAEREGELGFLARELLPRIPRLMNRQG